MRRRPYKDTPLQWLKDRREVVEFTLSNWRRRVKEQSKCFSDVLQPVSEYQRRVKKCEQDLALIDAELKRREIQLAKKHKDLWPKILEALKDFEFEEIDEELCKRREKELYQDEIIVASAIIKEDEKEEQQG